MVFSRTTILLTLIGFILWVLPVGYFFKVAQESELCGGKRAVCLCKLAMKKIEQTSKVKIFKTAQPIETNAPTDPVSSPDYLPNISRHISKPNLWAWNHCGGIIDLSDDYHKATEHVPITFS